MTNGHSPGGGSPLRFDANLKWLFTELPFEERFDAAAAAGFTAVEYANPYLFSPRDLRKRLEDAGLSQIVINTPVDGPGTPGRSGVANQPDRVKSFRAGFDSALEYAVALDSDFIHLMAGVRPEGLSSDRAFAQFTTNVAWAADRVKGSGVRIVLEAQNLTDSPRYTIETQARAAAVVEAVGSDDVGLMLDVYHVQMQEGGVVAKLTEFLPRAFHVQVADPPTRTEPGTGELAWDTVFSTIRTSGYSGWIGCEYRPAAGTITGLGWIERWA